MSEEPDQAAPMSTWRSMARSLAHRNYRLFFVGQGISLIGTRMTWVASGWLVFRSAALTLLCGALAFDPGVGSNPGPGEPRNRAEKAGESGP